MKIAIELTPLKDNQHKVRGSGFYIENLKNSLLKYCAQNEYIFFNRRDKLPANIDLIHYPFFDPFFLTLPLRKKFKTAVTVHDLTPLVFPNNFPSGIKGRFKWQLQKIALKNADVIITDSQCSKKDIVRFTGMPESKVQVVYLAAGEEFKRVQSSKLKVQSLRTKYNLPKEFALYVGDVTWNKNLPGLIEAVQQIKAPLVMIGKALVNENYDKTNPWNYDLTKVHKLIKNDQNIILSGFVSAEDLVVLYNIATVFIMPSLYEGFGLPILEAMSCGCPVITSKEGSIPEIAGDAVCYVDAYNKNSLSEGIKKVFEDRKLQRELSGKGLMQAKRFSWEKTANLTNKVYEKIL